ncbi:MAG TPA: hypothetical protein VJH03_00070 [Blastocatellia bacterium]|nr:hypothetical protein [Blastocatellia bacterium]
MVENIPIPLANDEHFREFDKLIHRRPDSIVRATVVGRFFSGQQVRYPAGVFWSGYGHMGCCSLLAIQQVLSVYPHDRDDVDYCAAPDQPRIDKVGCGFRDLLRIRPQDDLIEAQRRAEHGQREWSFSDPQRVASDALARLLNTGEAAITGMKQTRKAQGRMVYEWPAKAKSANYVIVVSRPYWLSFYAEDPKRIAWVVIAAYESSCSGDNPVTRVR